MLLTRPWIYVIVGQLLPRVFQFILNVILNIETVPRQILNNSII